MLTPLTPEQKFEQIVLNSLMKDKEIFSKIFGILDPKFFSGERKEILKLIKEHYREYNTVASTDDLMLSVKNIQGNELRQRVSEELDTIKGQEFKISKDKMAEETLTFVKDALYLEALEIGSQGLLEKNDALKIKAQQLLDERSKVNISSDVGIEFSDVDAIIDYYGKDTQGILTQHYSINTRLGSGFLPGTLSLILAASGVGKSLLMTDLISGWVKAGKNVLLVSLEMAQEEVMKRVHSNVLEIPIWDFEPKHFNKEQFIAKLNDTRAKGAGLFYAKDFPAQSFSSLQLESLVETFKNEKDLEFDLVVVDYMGIMKSDIVSPNVGLYSYVKSIAEELRATAKRLALPIVSASQLNRSATNNTDTDNAAVSDSYGSVMTADFLMFLLQTEEMKEQGDIICKITKNRFSGKTETFPMKVDYQLMRFEDPEIPRSMEARQELKEQFDMNSESTDQVLKELQALDVKIASEHDKNLNKETQQPQQVDSLTDVLDSLL